MQTLNFGYNPRDYGFSGLPTLTAESGDNIVAIVNQASVEDEPFQILVIDADGQPIEHRNAYEWANVLGFLFERDYTLDQNGDDVKRFLRGE